MLRHSPAGQQTGAQSQELKKSPGGENALAFLSPACKWLGFRRRSWRSFFSGFGLGGFCRLFRGAFGITAGFRRIADRGRCILFCSLLIFVAAIICNVKAAAFEKQACPTAD